MIPYRIVFSGIRDFPATRLTFGEASEHVLITGPNGTGKSTLAFCFGAVLNSSRVSLEGLRSNNIPDEQTWRASITLTFKNSGRSQIDGPAFIAFRINIEQVNAHSIPQREYSIFYGDTIDEMTLENTFRSGDANKQNFSLYNEQLKHKYRIFPDMYYLIWYQQEVNQFATYSPEERFRRFSDMYGISSIQQKWEAQIAQLRETNVTLHESKQIVKNAKQMLNRAQNDLNDFNANQKRITESGKQLIIATLSLSQMEQKAIASNTRKREENERKLQDDSQKVATILHQRKALQNQLEHFEKKLHDAYMEKKAQNSKKTNLQQQIAAAEPAIRQLKEQLAETESQQNRLRYSKEETESRLREASETIAAAEMKSLGLQQDKITINTTSDSLKQQISKAELEIDELLNKQQQMNQTVKLYGSSHHVQAKMQELQQSFQYYYQKSAELDVSIAAVKKQIEALQQNKIYSTRQQQGLQQIRKQAIEAFALRDLIELTENASAADEKLLNSIKYSIFYDAKTIAAPNDLYYVSLKSIIPDRLVVSLLQLKLRIRPELNERDKVFASKALYWISQFFVQEPKIVEGTLFDSRGARGSQEQNTLILSEKAVKQSLLNYRSELQRYEEELASLKQNQLKNEAEHQRLSNAFTAISQAESFMREASLLPNKQELLQQLVEEAGNLLQQNNDIDSAITQLYDTTATTKFEQSNLQQDLDIYAKLGKLAHLQNELRLLVEKYNGNKNSLQVLKEQQMQTDKTIMHYEDNKRSIQNQQRDLKYDLQDSEREIVALNKLIASLVEQVENSSALVTKYEIELAEVEATITAIYAEAQEDPLIEGVSKTELLSMKANAHANFMDARHAKVNPQAPQNYASIEKDYTEKRETVLETEKRIEELSQHTEELAKNLEQTISMHVRRLRHLFENYMDEFGFEGTIESERYEDKTGRTIFQLFLKVRKRGHRGSLTEVSIKARNGKFGKGVSGGEESLSSLLFALALLKNLQTSPNFILLDEFDSALDDNRKEKVFALYNEQLERKLFILSPKTHDEGYYNNFSRAFIIDHDSSVPISRVKSLMKNL